MLRARAALDRAGAARRWLRGLRRHDVLERADLILAMSREHVREARDASQQGTSVVLFRNLLELGLDLDVADPTTRPSDFTMPRSL